MEYLKSLFLNEASFGQFAKDSRMFIGNKESEKLEQGEAIIAMKDRPQTKVRVVYER